MYAVKDARRRKFLRGFSGSFNSFKWRCSCKLRQRLGREPTRDELWRDMFSAGPEDAKVYRTRGGAESSFYSMRYRSVPVTSDMPIVQNSRGTKGVMYRGEFHPLYRDGCIITRLPLMEALPNLRIVPVRVKA